MANTRDKVILLDGPRNAVVRLVGLLDSSDESWKPAVLLSDFRNNDTGARATFVGFRVDKLQFAAPLGLTAILAWNANTPQMISTVSSGDDIGFKKAGGLQPNQLNSGYDGNINLTTVGFVPGKPVGYTIELSLVKLYK